MRFSSQFGFVLPVILSVSFSALPSGSQSAIEEDEGQRIVRERCTMCHGEDLIAQQRFAKAGWVRSLQKMRGWGGGITEGQIELLADYLSRRYPEDAEAPAPSRITTHEVQQLIEPDNQPPLRAQPGGSQIFQSHCALCHGVNGRGQTAPNLFTPLLMRGEAWKEIVLQGRNLMPAWMGKLTEPEILSILSWLREEAGKL